LADDGSVEVIFCNLRELTTREELGQLGKSTLKIIKSI